MLLFERVGPMRSWIHGKSVDTLLDGEVLQLARLSDIVDLQNRDGAAAARHADTSKSGIGHTHAGRSASLASAHFAPACLELDRPVELVGDVKGGR